MTAVASHRQWRFGVDVEQFQDALVDDEGQAVAMLREFLDHAVLRCLIVVTMYHLLEVPVNRGKERGWLARSGDLDGLARALGLEGGGEEAVGFEGLLGAGAAV